MYTCGRLLESTYRASVLDRNSYTFLVSIEDYTHTQDLVVSYLHTGLVRVWLHTTQKQPSALPKASVTVSIIYPPEVYSWPVSYTPPPWIHPVTHSYDTGLASYANSCMRVHFQVLTVWLLHITSLGFVHSRVVSRACT